MENTTIYNDSPRREVDQGRFKADSKVSKLHSQEDCSYINKNRKLLGRSRVWREDDRCIFKLSVQIFVHYVHS